MFAPLAYQRILVTAAFDLALATVEACRLFGVHAWPVVPTIPL